MTDELKRLTAARDAAWKEVRRAKSSWWGAIKRRVDYDYILHRSQEYRDAKKKWIAAFKAECEATRAARLANPDWLRCIFPKSSRGLPISALSVPEYARKVKANCAALLKYYGFRECDVDGN